MLDESAGVDSGLIDALGGTVAAARLFDVTPQAVSHWRRHGIPKPRRMYLELLRPDLRAVQVGVDIAPESAPTQEASHAG